MRWIDLALVEIASDQRGTNIAYELASEAGRAQIAEAVIRALPKHVIAAAIMSGAHAVLVQRGIADGNNALSQEIGNNAAATVLLMLEVGE